MVPFFHVHPEADHRHGDDQHVHGGTFHTVFSQDLECEYAEAAHDSTCPDAAHQHLQSLVHAGHGLNHPEIQFSLLTGQFDRPLPKPGAVVAIMPVVAALTGLGSVLNDSWSPVPSHTTPDLSTSRALRAPPVQSI